MKFFLYSLVGGLIMLAAVIGLYVVSSSQFGAGTFAFDALRHLHITPGTQKLLFLGFFVAFAIKAPLVPFHTWLPDAGAEAPVGGAVLLVGVLDKVGTFGFLRYCLPLFPDASRFFAPYVLVLAVAGILYAALLAMGQSDMKRLVAYTSISHFGFIALGIFVFTTRPAPARCSTWSTTASRPGCSSSSSACSSRAAGRGRSPTTAAWPPRRRCWRARSSSPVSPRSRCP